MNGDDHFIQSDNNSSPTNTAHALRKLYRGQPLIDQAANEIERQYTNVRHWRDECGKLHAQIAKLKADLQAWEITAKRVAEAEARKAPDDGSCLRCGAVPRTTSGLCATCVDEDAVRAGEVSDMAGVAEQSGAGAPETSVRCGAPAAHHDHDWQIWPETDGQEQRCLECGAYRKTPTH